MEKYRSSYHFSERIKDERYRVLRKTRRKRRKRNARIRNLLILLGIISIAVGVKTSLNKRIYADNQNVSPEFEAFAKDIQKAIVLHYEKEFLGDEEYDLVADKSVEEAYYLFNEDGVFKAKKVKETFYLRSFDKEYGGAGSGYIDCLYCDNKSYLVDAYDYGHILVEDFDWFNIDGRLNNDEEQEEQKFYLVRKTNNKFYLLDKSSFETVIGGLDEFESLKKSVYLKASDSVVTEIHKNGKKYLVNANCFDEVLLAEYDKIEENATETIVTYEDGRIKTYEPGELKPTISNILKRKL